MEKWYKQERWQNSFKLLCLRHTLNIKCETKASLQKAKLWGVMVLCSFVTCSWINDRLVQAVSYLKNLSCCSSLQLLVGWARVGVIERCLKALSFLNHLDWGVLLSHSSWSEQRYSDPGWLRQSPSLSLSICKVVIFFAGFRSASVE